MERLTKRTTDAMMLCPLLLVLEDDNEYCQSQNCDCDNCKLGEQLSKLSNYESLEEQGLLVKFPCKLGGEVWRIYTQHDSYDESPYKITTRDSFRLDMLNCIGKTVFLTKEEAEAKLKEYQSEVLNK